MDHGQNGLHVGLVVTVEVKHGTEMYVPVTVGDRHVIPTEKNRPRAVVVTVVMVQWLDREGVTVRNLFILRVVLQVRMI